MTARWARLDNVLGDYENVYSSTVCWHVGTKSSARSTAVSSLAAANAVRLDTTCLLLLLLQEEKQTFHVLKPSAILLPAPSSTNVTNAHFLDNAIRCATWYGIAG